MTADGYVQRVDGDEVEILLREDGQVYVMPAAAAAGLREGDEVVVDGDPPRIRLADLAPATPAPDRYLTPDELRERADPWDG